MDLMRKLCVHFSMTIICSTAQPADKQWSPAEMMKVKSISDVQIAPGNQEVFFVVGSAVMDDEEHISPVYKARDKGNADAVALTEADSSAEHATLIAG